MLPARTCPSPRCLLRRTVLTSGLLLSLAQGASAQYMSITTDNPADSTLLNPSGTTVLTLTLDTIHDRDGSLQACNSHSNQQGCGAVLTGQPLDLFSYTITLTSSGGTLAWGVFTAADPAFEPLGQDLADEHETEFTRNAPLGTITPPGRIVLGTIPVTVLSGTPSIQFARGPRPIDPFGFGTGFGTDCDGFNFANTYVLGDPQNLCPTGDWYDADGVPRLPPPGPNQAPTLNPIHNMTVANLETADQAISASDPEGTPILFMKPRGPSYMTVTTSTLTSGNIHLAPRSFDWGAYAIVRVTDGYLSSEQTIEVATYTGPFAPIIHAIPDITMTQGDTLTVDIVASYGGGNQLVTFGKLLPSFVQVFTTGTQSGGDGGAIATGRLVLHPGPTNVGHSTAVIYAQFGNQRSAWEVFITVLPQDHPPSNSFTGDHVIAEGTTGSQVYTATDPDDDAVSLHPVHLPPFASAPDFVSGQGSVSLTIQFSPGYSDAGSYPFSVSMGSTNFLASIITGIEVTNVNRCPVPVPGGPYFGSQGTPVEFDGSASSDPDGDELTYSWDFDASNGIAVDATGAKPSHTFDSFGSRVVTLTVADPAGCAQAATTTMDITPTCAASIQNGYDLIRLGPGRPTWFISVQSEGTCFTTADVRMETLVLKYGGREVHVDGTKTAITEDRNHDGVSEIRATFSKQSLRTLLLPDVRGRQTVTLGVEAVLTSGGRLLGTTQVDVLNNAPLEAAVAPNPLNPQATLTYTVASPGLVRIDLYDVHGRHVRSLQNEIVQQPGTFDLTLDGRDARGHVLPSGVYFVRGVLAGRAFTRSVTILK